MGSSEGASERSAGEPLARLLARSDAVARDLERVRLRLLELERSLAADQPERHVTVLDDAARRRRSDER